MSEVEFSRPVRVDTLAAEPSRMTIAAEEQERAALAARFGLVGIDSLVAAIHVERGHDEIVATGRIEARLTQICVATGEPIEQAISEPFTLRFRPAPSGGKPDEEIELAEAELDTILYEGAAIDLGEAAAQTLALALDPYPRSPGAEAALKAAGVKSEEEAGPFGALAGLRDKLGK